ncbi:MAG: hypothetical protein EXR79_17240 [Myxococcales bacterium]|nr:hypothetical protein [Myxococcales bacterium]
MAIPVGPASRPKRRLAPSSVDNTEVAQSAQQPVVTAQSEPAPASTRVAHTDPALAEKATPEHQLGAARADTATSGTHGRSFTTAKPGSSSRLGTAGGAFAGQVRTLRQGRSPSEIIARDALSPAVLALSLVDFFELLYEEQVGPSHVTVEEFLRMRDSGIWPELFTAGDPCALFTEEMCRRGQFVPLAWHQDGLSFATCKDDSSQDDLAKALDVLVRAPVTLFTVPAESVDAGVHWLFHRRLPT